MLLFVINHHTVFEIAFELFQILHVGELRLHPPEPQGPYYAKLIIPRWRHMAIGWCGTHVRRLKSLLAGAPPDLAWPTGRAAMQSYRRGRVEFRLGEDGLNAAAHATSAGCDLNEAMLGAFVAVLIVTPVKTT